MDADQNLPHHCSGISQIRRFPRNLRLVFLSLMLVFAVLACNRSAEPPQQKVAISEGTPVPEIYKPLPSNAYPNLKKFIETAVAQVGVTTGYDPAYVSLIYPGGDVPKETGVCSDVIVRAFRGVGIDLQKEIHEDMARAWAEYPKRWGLSGPDRNIDHRRVPNLMTYLDRKHKTLSITDAVDDYRPGDIVTWDLGGGVDHIGIVTDRLSAPNGRSLIAHNIGAGARMEDVLFQWKITGHYRYF